MNKFLIVCSFYNNTKEHIKQTFDNVLNQTYKNWTLIVADDFSTNDCKKWLLEEIKLRNEPKVVYYQPKYKRELYLYQNFFLGIKYDFYFDLDADDILHPKILEIYDYHFREYPHINSLFCDFSCTNEKGELQRFSAIYKEDPIEAFELRCKGDDLLTFSKGHSWSMFGHGRCWRKHWLNHFWIEHEGRTATDSFVLFSCLRNGDHMTVPRNLYTWKLREGSDSSFMSAEEYEHYNDNTLLAIANYKEVGVGKVSGIYKYVWLETNALSNCAFQDEKYIDVITSGKPDNSILNLLYYDKHLTFTEFNSSPKVVIWNTLIPSMRENILLHLQSHPDTKFCIYYFYDGSDKPEDISKACDSAHNKVMMEVGNKMPYRYFKYYRHLIIHGNGA